MFTPNKHVASFFEFTNIFFILSGKFPKAFIALNKFGLLNLLYIILFVNILSCGRILTILLIVSLSLFQTIS